MASAKAMLTLWTCLATLALLQPAWAQMPWPLQGQNAPPPGVTGISVDIVVDSFRAINSNANSWHGVHWVHLSWVDNRAAGAIQTATQAWTDAASDGNVGYVQPDKCGMFCDSSKSPSAGCCDRVWLPHIEANNLVGLAQEGAYRWHVWVDTNTSTAAKAPPPAGADVPGGVAGNTTGAVNGTVTTGGNVVHWVTRITAEWMSPFDFRAWPFEHQHLLMELQIGSSIADRAYLVLRHAAVLSNTPTAKGDALPGWHVAKITKRVFDNSGCFSGTNTTSVYTIEGAPQTVNIKPLQPRSWAQVQNNQTNATAATQIATTACDATFNTAEVAQYGPQIIIMDTMVRRTQIYYILSTILPLLLLDYMVFITYAMERSDLESRMGVVVTLVLAVSALQFTYDFPPASYLNAVQQITLTSYVLYFIVAVESMIASHICRLHSRKRSYEAMTALAAQRNASIGRPDMSMESRASIDAPGVVALGLAASQVPASMTPFDHTNTGIGGLGRYKRGASQSEAGGHHMSITGPPTTQVSRAVTPRTSETHMRSSVFDLNGDPEPSAHVPAAIDTASHLSITMTNRRSRGAGPLAEALESVGRGMDSDPEAEPWRFKPGCMGGFGGRNRSKSQDRQDRNSCDERTRSGNPTKLRTRSSFEFKRIGSSVTTGVSNAMTKSRAMQKRIDADEAYAQLIAARMDRWFSYFLLVSFTVVVAVLLYVNQQVGDHRLMMGGDAPANM